MYGHRVRVGCLRGRHARDAGLETRALSECELNPRGPRWCCSQRGPFLVMALWSGGGPKLPTQPLALGSHEPSGGRRNLAPSASEQVTLLVSGKVNQTLPASHSSFGR